jgi:CubicO group peptidase (beta-lactamase class C family)
MQLAEAGALSIDGPLTDYLTDYPTQGHHVTIRHLLTHTSGIKSLTDPDVYTRLTAAERAHDWTNYELRALFQDRPFAFTPGEQFRYNNSGYILLGMVVEAASGVSYRDYAADRLFRPLGLTNSSYCDNRPSTPSRAHGYDYEYGELSHPPYMSLTYPGGAGALCSTVVDLLAWSSALRSGQVVSSEAFERMITPTVLERGDTVPYGFGLELRPRRGQPVVSHGGAIEGFQSHLAYYRDANLDVVVLTNTPGLHLGQIARQVASWALDPPTEPAPR